MPIETNNTGSYRANISLMLRIESDFAIDDVGDVEQRLEPKRSWVKKLKDFGTRCLQSLQTKRRQPALQKMASLKGNNEQYLPVPEPKQFIELEQKINEPPKEIGAVEHIIYQIDYKGPPQFSPRFSMAVSGSQLNSPQASPQSRQMSPPRGSQRSPQSLRRSRIHGLL